MTHALAPHIVDANGITIVGVAPVAPYQDVLADCSMAPIEANAHDIGVHGRRIKLCTESGRVTDLAPSANCREILGARTDDSFVHLKDFILTEDF